MKTVQFTVQEITCSQCVIALESIEDALDGVQRAEASLRRQSLKVEFDETKTSVEDIIAVVAQKGYQLKLLA